MITIDWKTLTGCAVALIYVVATLTKAVFENVPWEAISRREDRLKRATVLLRIEEAELKLREDTAALRSRQRAEQVRSEERALELGELPDWWKWVPADAGAHSIREFVERDGERVAWVRIDNTFHIRLESTETYVEGCATIAEAKAACERVYLARVGVAGKGGGG